MCCLKYENDEYEAAKEELPDMGAVIKTPHGKGKVVGLNILERILQVEIKEEERVLEFTLDEIMNESAVSFQATE
jgi:cell fate regulator YaaT (PSP1 superfamily)